MLCIVGDPVYLALVHQLLVLVDCLPVNVSVPEDLDATLVVGEARVLPGDGADHVDQVLALGHLCSEHAAAFGQLVRELDHRVTELPVLSVLAKHLVEVVEDAGDSLPLVGVLQSD